MKEERICIVNGIDIVAVEKDGEVYVPIRQLCQAIGLSYATQLEKIKGDPTYEGSTVPLGGTVAADGKEREMVCLPLCMTYLWLGSVNPRNVKEEVRENVIAYRLECARALYDYFSGTMARTLETNAAEIAALEAVNAAIMKEREAKGERRKAEAELEKIRAERLNPQPRLL